ncbi:MAG: amino acid carrier protein [Chlamydiota bacterium]
MDIKTLLSLFNHTFTLCIIFPAIILLGFYLTFKLRFVQVFQLRKSFNCLVKGDCGQEGNISRFGAIASVLAGNFGTGNISGMAVAIATGGPGALVWMWVMAFFGAAVQYVSCILSVSYREKTKSGEFVGGPMYYLKNGLGFKKTAVVFAVFTIFGSIAVGNFAQINSVVLPLQKMGLNPLYTSMTIAVLVGVVILGGIQRIASFATYIVPVKASLYLGAALTVIVLNYDQVIPAFQLMFRHAFGLAPAIGGVLGAGILKALTTGFDRGLFATDAGTGVVPILQAGARSENPIMDGIATLIAPLIVMIVCTATGLVLILTGAWQIPELQSTNMVTYAFTKGLGSSIGEYVVVAALILFAYTTILAWSYCGEKALGYLIGSEKGRYFRVVYILLVPVGSVLQVGMVWTLADISITLMLAANLVGVIGLSRRVIESTRKFQSASF